MSALKMGLCECTIYQNKTEQRNKEKKKKRQSKMEFSSTVEAISQRSLVVGVWFMLMRLLMFESRGSCCAGFVL